MIEEGVAHFKAGYSLIDAAKSYWQREIIDNVYRKMQDCNHEMLDQFEGAFDYADGLRLNIESICPAFFILKFSLIFPGGIEYGMFVTMRGEDYRALMETFLRAFRLYDDTNDPSEDETILAWEAVSEQCPSLIKIDDYNHIEFRF